MESQTGLSWKRPRDDLVPPTHLVARWLSQPWQGEQAPLASEATSSLFNNDYEGIKGVFPQNPPSSAPAAGTGFDSRLVTKRDEEQGGLKAPGKCPHPKIPSQLQLEFPRSDFGARPEPPWVTGQSPPGCDHHQGSARGALGGCMAGEGCGDNNCLW